MSATAHFVILACFITYAYSACVKVDSCRDGAMDHDIGEYYNVGCRRCECTQSRKTIITCYRDNDGIFKINRIYRYWMHYYIEVNATEAEDIQCPRGMKEVDNEITSNAQFYINYVLIEKTATCCDSVPRALVNPRTFCKAVPIEGDCDNYKFVLKSKTNVECPLRVQQKMRYLV